MDRLYTVDEQSNMRFLQLPKQLFENERYKALSVGAKVMYSILRDRQDLSIVNKWVDKKGFIFFYYDVRNLSDYMQISTSTINRYKKELHKHELLIEARQGLNKPNRLYILKPVSLENTRSSQNDYTRIVNMINQEVSKSLQSDTECIDTESKDTEYTYNQAELDRLPSFIDNYSIQRFDKHLRDCNVDYNFSDLEDFEEADMFEFLNENITSYDQCNLDYIFTIQARAR